MRVISQNGTSDFPYEKIVIWRDERVISAYFSGLGETIMAQYSSDEKAEKAMKKLHECYTGGLRLMENVSMSEEDLERIKNMKQGFIKIIDREDNVRIEQMNTIFRFPTEEELE